MEAIKGYEYTMDLEGQSTERFAHVLLALVNTKSSNNRDAQIVDIETLYGTNKIFVKAKTDLTEWLKTLSNNDVQKEEVIMLTFGEDTVEYLVNEANVTIENYLLLETVEYMSDIHLVAENSL